MSRIGLNPIEIPEGVEVKLNDQTVVVKGPKGELTNTMHEDIVFEVEDNVVVVKRPDDLKEHRALHGTTRSLVGNMIEGVRNGYEKHLETIGVGYRAQMRGNKLVVGAGYSHPLEVDHREGIECDGPKNPEISAKGL